MKKDVKYVDKQYKLLGDSTPLAFILSSINKQRYPLLWFDESTGENRALRYARNQKSPFEDEQDGNAILEPIIFEDGFLMVPKSNQVLQKFLELHPANGIKYSVIDEAKEASEIVEDLNLEVDALIAARELSIEQIEAVTRVAFGIDPSGVTSSELRRDILLFAKQSPSQFLSLVNDASLDVTSKAQSFIDTGLLAFRKNKKEVFFNTPSNKKRMMVIPFGDEPVDAIASFLQSDDGLEVLEFLEKVAETK